MELPRFTPSTRNVFWLDAATLASRLARIIAGEEIDYATNLRDLDAALAEQVGWTEAEDF